MMTQSTFELECTLVEEYKKTKCPKTFGKLYNLFYASIFGYIHSIVEDKHIAFDLTQETFITASEKLCLLRESKALRLWIFRIARHQAMNYFRMRSKKEKLFHSLDFIESQSSPDVEEVLNRNHQYDVLQVVFKKLNHQEKNLLIKKYYHDMSIDDLVRQTGLGKSSVKMKIHRARAKLKQMMIETEAM
jgi:RNA polymerase sigma-70 factor (ECF subfamily)